MPEEAKGFRGLRVWHDAMDLAVAIYHLTPILPRQEAFGLSSQMQRAASSIPANIAEGRSREHPGDYVRHLAIAKGSLGELETFLELTIRLHYVDEAAVQPLLERCTSVGRQLHRLQAFAEAEKQRRATPPRSRSHSSPD
jgi:four helix bundle protein